MMRVKQILGGNPKRLLATVVGLAVIGLYSTGSSQAADAIFPNKTVRIISPFAPGGNTDIIGRLVANHLSSVWGQPVIVDTRPGAGATLGTEMGAKAPPDGYTLLMGTLAATAIAPSIYPKLRYDPLKDFAPISGLTIGYSAIGINPSVPAKTLSEFIAYAKDGSHKLAFSSPGPGVSSHLAMENFNFVTGSKIVHVPYRGSTPALLAVMSNETQVTFDPISTMAPLAKAGKIRVLAVAGLARSPLMPDVATTTELGYPTLQSSAWTGLVAPTGTPDAIIQKVRRDIEGLLQSKDFKTQAADLGFEVLDLAPKEYGKFVKDEADRWGDIARRANVKLE